VANNGSPAFSVTVPAGQAQASFTLNLRTFNSGTYNVEVVAWQPLGNLQSAWCLTVPNTLPMPRLAGKAERLGVNGGRKVSIPRKGSGRERDRREPGDPAA
jgi:hypothetical protein